ncbi:neuromedin-B [Rhynchocyon petersi]
MTRRAAGARLLGGLLLLALLAAVAAPLSWDLPEPRSRAGKIRVHPRGNLWATGHFMGKKSLETPSPSLLGTAPHISLRDQRLQLSHDLLRILLLKKALGVSLGSPGPHTQEAAGEHTAEVMQIMGQKHRRGSDCAHPGKVLNGTLVMAPSGCRSWDQISLTPLL